MVSKKLKSENTQLNMEILHDSDIDIFYDEGNRVVLIRELGVNADFYPSTNKWKDNLNKQRVLYGDANALLLWIKKHKLSN